MTAGIAATLAVLCVPAAASHSGPGPGALGSASHLQSRPASDMHTKK